jgi:hypothetical protein
MHIGARRQIWHGADVTELPATNNGFALLKPNTMRAKKITLSGCVLLRLLVGGAGTKVF